jgi:hypothetical protein
MVGMDRPQPSRRLPSALVALFAMLVAILAGYVSGYVFSDSAVDYMFFDGRPFTHRSFGQRWHCEIYAPLAKIESKWTDAPVMLSYNADANCPDCYNEYETYR